jgi:carboxyl-terminal processing protease
VHGVNRLDAGDAWNYLLDPDQGIAYVRLTGFNPDSQKELARALEQATKQGMKGLVLDLRYNPGGLLDVAVKTVSMFLKDGEVVSTRGRNDRDDKSGDHLDVDKGETRYPDLPLIVLVNSGSASASEILAGALQDHNRAVVLGERTYGKGSVQRVLPLGTEARLKLTTALYYLPSGTPKEARRFIEHDRAAAIISKKAKDKDVAGGGAEQQKSALDDVKADANEKDSEPLLSVDEIKLLDSDVLKAPDADPLIETALLNMRVKLAGGLPWPRQVAANTKADKR